jgi:hypothetical protein
LPALSAAKGSNLPSPRLWERLIEHSSIRGEVFRGEVMVSLSQDWERARVRGLQVKIN